jgi:hypothetical protein
MRFLVGLPLLVFPVAAYHVLVFLTATPIEETVVSFAVPSGVEFLLTAGHVMLAVGLVLLYVEIFKSTRTGAVSIIDHLLSMLLMVVCIVELVLLSEMATGTFFLLTLMTLIDVIAGFTVTISAARRDFGVNA